MPTYQYACTSCGHQLEAVQSFSDAALTECPECQGSLRKVFSAVGIVFKGSGFYRTDSRADKSGSSKTGSTPSTPAQKESTTSSTTSAPATPAPAAAPAAAASTSASN